MNNNIESSEELNKKSDLKYKYYELTKLYKSLINEILKKNGKEIVNSDFMIDGLSKIMVIYPEKQDVIKEIIHMYYSDIILTENSLNTLASLYKEMYKLIEIC